MVELRIFGVVKQNQCLKMVHISLPSPQIFFFSILTSLAQFLLYFKCRPTGQQSFGNGATCFPIPGYPCILYIV